MNTSKDTNSSTTQTAYRAAGVDTAAAAHGLRSLLSSLRATFEHRPVGRGRVLVDFGHYAGIIDLGHDVALAISTDGVGSKILIAEMLGRYDTLGIDLVAMNANDLVCVGAEPLAMVDYIATERLDGTVLGELGQGLLKGAELAGITIPAGEIAQLPEMIRGARSESGLDLVGTCIGTLKTDQILPSRRLRGGEALVGLASSGLHSNGYTLARRVLLADAGLDLREPAPGLERPLGDVLLEPTAIYVRAALQILTEVETVAMAHVTGDGLSNLLRLSPGTSFELDALPAPAPIFRLIAEHGNVDQKEMYEVFNMGIGFVVIVPEDAADDACRVAEDAGHPASIIGHTVADLRGEVRIDPGGIVLGGDRAGHEDE